VIRTPVASVTDQKLEEVNVKRIRRVLFAVPVTALVAASVALAEGRPLSARSATVRVAKTNLGKILVSDSGATLFVFTRDGHNRDKCVTVRGCSAVWPPLKVRGKPVAAPSRCHTTGIRFTPTAFPVVPEIPHMWVHRNSVATGTR
jgi:hypothetical protein